MSLVYILYYEKNKTTEMFDFVLVSTDILLDLNYV